jgi:hypothetical protein
MNSNELTYSHFLKLFRQRWQPGQHVTIMGPTGSGKTWILADVLNLRKYAVVLCTKGRDVTMHRFVGWKILDTWQDRYYREHHVILWPRARTLEEAKRNIRPRVKEALDSIYVEGGWTLGLDDLRYLCDALGLKNDLMTMYGQVRSHGTSLVACGQRPFGIIQPALDQASHWLLFYQADKRDIERMAEVSGLSRHDVTRANAALRGRDFLWMQSMEQPILVRRAEA